MMTSTSNAPRRRKVFPPPPRPVKTVVPKELDDSDDEESVPVPIKPMPTSEARKRLLGDMTNPLPSSSAALRREQSKIRSQIASALKSTSEEAMKPSGKRKSERTQTRQQEKENLQGGNETIRPTGNGEKKFKLTETVVEEDSENLIETDVEEFEDPEDNIETDVEDYDMPVLHSETSRTVSPKQVRIEAVDNKELGKVSPNSPNPPVLSLYGDLPASNVVPTVSTVQSPVSVHRPKRRGKPPVKRSSTIITRRTSKM